MPKLLLVEDEPEIAESIVDALESAGHIVEWVPTKSEGSELLFVYNYDLIVLDWNLGSESGLDLCSEYRSKGGHTPILMLTGKSSVADKVAGLEHGADDYLAKPFDVSELNARVNALLRRPKNSYVTEKSGDLEIDARRGVVTRKGEEIPMRNLELAVLSFLMRHPDQHFTSNDLLNRVWSGESESSEEAVRKTINRIRQKIDTEDASYIANVKNLGYRIRIYGRD
jgi:two-component system, OmpR family, manganese sensing response regulator